ncbi:hypothetical protein RND71_030559 [Anisodus tanguticus]|uniref:Uncharacterized protein n=1 Tax=Anisodus tanguticus TaxID=243964 RepID=A0AAE1RHP9_9SOLA|nr:hypothetical protein RND71_030559 [Anisodus tanguticus]
MKTKASTMLFLVLFLFLFLLHLGDASRDSFGGWASPMTKFNRHTDQISGEIKTTEDYAGDHNVFDDVYRQHEDIPSPGMVSWRAKRRTETVFYDTISLIINLDNSLKSKDPRNHKDVVIIMIGSPNDFEMDTRFLALRERKRERENPLGEPKNWWKKIEYGVVNIEEEFQPKGEIIQMKKANQYL